MSQPQTNGHAPQQPQQPTAHPEAIRQALMNRIDAQRHTINQAQDEADMINAMLITEQAKTMSLSAENARLTAELEELKGEKTDEPLPEGAAGN